MKLAGQTLPSRDADVFWSTAKAWNLCDFVSANGQPSLHDLNNALIRGMAPANTGGASQPDTIGEILTPDGGDDGDGIPKAVDSDPNSNNPFDPHNAGG